MLNGCAFHDVAIFHRNNTIDINKMKFITIIRIPKIAYSLSTKCRSVWYSIFDYNSLLEAITYPGIKLQILYQQIKYQGLQN